jgi:diguanylate cyclase (GGDEF)-like protein
MSIQEAATVYSARKTRRKQSMARLTQSKAASGNRILLVDDQDDYRIATHSLLTRQGHEVITAPGGREALSVLRQQFFDLVLLDYFMPGGLTGEQVIEEIRRFNKHVQIILQTGYSGEFPPREMLRRLDIQGYHDKSDGPEKLLLWVDAGLKVAHAVQMLYKSRQGLKYILNVTPELHKIQTLDHLLQGILLQITGLLGTANSFLAVLPEENSINQANPDCDALLAMLKEGTDLQISVATGKFSNKRSLESCLDNAKIEAIYTVLKRMEIKYTNDYTIIPLTVGEAVLGLIFLEKRIDNEQDLEIIQIFANQAAVAIQNTGLYAIATNDKLTGVYVRNFFTQCLLRELHSCFRQRCPISLIMVDLDGLKQINDTAGHLAGDTALSIIGKVLRKVTRANDLVGRYGGDEFIILLPNTPIENVYIAAQRIQAGLADQNLTGAFGSIPIRCSIGACGIAAPEYEEVNASHPSSNSYYTKIAQVLIAGADQMLSQAKQNGRSCYAIGNNLKWSEF